MKKNLNEIFDGFTPEELDKLSDELNAEKLPDEVMSAIKDKVYAKTNIKNTLKVKNAHRTPRAVWLRTAAVAACFAVIVGAVALFPTLRRDDSGALPDASPDGGDASTTTTAVTTTKKDNTPKIPLGYTSSGGYGSPPIMISFSSIEDIQDFIAAANGTKEEFDKYHKEEIAPLLGITYKVSQAIAHNLEIVDFPTMPFKGTEDTFGATYYLDRNEIDVLYTVNDLRYSFIYKYSVRSIPTTKRPLFQENVHIGDNTVDLYEGTGCLVGYFMDDMVLVQAIVYSDDYQTASFEGITFKPLADIK